MIYGCELSRQKWKTNKNRKSVFWLAKKILLCYRELPVAERERLLWVRMVSSDNCCKWIRRTGCRLTQKTSQVSSATIKALKTFYDVLLSLLHLLARSNSCLCTLESITKIDLLDFELCMEWYYFTDYTHLMGYFWLTRTFCHFFFYVCRTCHPKNHYLPINGRVRRPIEYNMNTKMVVNVTYEFHCENSGGISRWLSWINFSFHHFILE